MQDSRCRSGKCWAGRRVPRTTESAIRSHTSR